MGGQWVTLTLAQACGAVYQQLLGWLMQERGSCAQEGPQEVMKAQLLHEPQKSIVFLLAFPRTQLAGLGVMGLRPAPSDDQVERGSLEDAGRYYVHLPKAASLCTFFLSEHCLFTFGQPDPCR